MQIQHTGFNKEECVLKLKSEYFRDGDTMLHLRLYDENCDMAVYHYYPERSNDYGIVKINKMDGSIEVIKVATSDTNSVYLHHTISRITEYFENGQYEKETVVAWY